MYAWQFSLSTAVELIPLVVITKILLIMSSSTFAGADLGILLRGGCELESHPGVRLLVAGKARHKLGGSGGMLPQENFEFSCLCRSILVHSESLHSL